MYILSIPGNPTKTNLNLREKFPLFKLNFLSLLNEDLSHAKLSYKLAINMQVNHVHPKDIWGLK